MITRQTSPVFPSPVDPVTGLIKWVYDLPVEPGEPALFNAAVKMADTSRYLGVPCYDQNGGSGLTRKSARQAAIGEGLERYCASACDPGRLIFGTANDLSRHHECVPPESFALFHPEQQAPYPIFTRDLPIAWIEGVSLIHHRPMLVPACLVCLPYQPQFLDQGEQGVGAAISTGLACGTTVEAALMSGICECIERDAVMLTWLNRLPMPTADITASPKLASLYHERFARDGLRYWLIDITTDLPVPTMLCLVIDERTDPPMISAGGASSLDPVHAATKAMIEAVQTREWGKVLPGDKAPALRADYANVRDFEDHVVLYAHGDMLPSLDFLNKAAPRQATSWNSSGSGNLHHDLQMVLDMLRHHQIEVIALDLTTPDVAACGYSVVKVLMPALIPLYADYRERYLGGQRLYEVPRILGFTSENTTLASINPDPHPYP